MTSMPQIVTEDSALATSLWEGLLKKVNTMIADALAQREGAHRSFTWSFYDPALYATQGLPLAPASYPVDLVCRPVDFVITCADGFPPSGTLSCKLRYSTNKGVSWLDLSTPTTIASGAYYGAGATFPVTATEKAAGINYRILRPGDMVTLETAPAWAGAKGIVLHMRTQRVREHALIGRT